jgi:peptidoglycan/LPS O-acetylase OafA/YrhL
LPLGFFSLAMPVFMTYAFFWLAFTFSFPRFDAKGDYSYGTYIYAFPVQQALALAGLQEEGLVLYFSASLVITVMLAVLSYRLVEAPALRWKNADLLASIRNRIGRPTSPAVVTTETEPVGVEA